MTFTSLRTALTIAAASSPAFANRRTLAITLVAAPLLSTLMLAAVIGSIPGTDLRGAVYAGILLSAFTSVMSGTNATLAYERHTGVVPAASIPRFGTPTYWMAKPVLPLISAAVVSLTSLGSRSSSTPRGIPTSWLERRRPSPWPWCEGRSSVLRWACSPWSAKTPTSSPMCSPASCP